MIEFDFNNVRQEIIGQEHGVDIDFELANYSEQIKDILNKAYQITEINSWLNGDYQHELISDILDYSELVRGKFENINIIGTDTPVLGIKAMAQTLLKSYWNSLDNEQRNGFPKLNFINNIYPNNLNGLLLTQNLSKSLFIFISKDDNEPETMALFMFLKNMLEEEIGENYIMHIVSCTKESSLFHRISEQEGYKCFFIPYETIGNFAIMSTCGLLPLSLAGINIKEMLKGAKDVVEMTKNPNIRENPIVQYALISYLETTQRNKNVSIMTSFTSEFKELPIWCAQYKAEMLCKRYDVNNKMITTEQIPIGAQSSNNQNSLLKMIIEGNNNKIVTIIKIENFTENYQIPSLFDYTAIGYLGGKTFKYLLDAEIEAMKMVLTDYLCPNITISIPQITPYYIGYFMAMFMMNMVIQAFLLKINPFNWAGAENIQNYVCAQMGRYGYDETLKEMQEKLAKIKKQPVLPEVQLPISD